MDQSRLTELFPLLDRAVFERLDDGSFQLGTTPPVWLAELIGTRGERATLLAALPYLEAFLGEAEDFWWHGTEGLVWSDLFTTSGAGEELLLRAAAVTLPTSRLLVLERLTGDADTRPGGRMRSTTGAIRADGAPARSARSGPRPGRRGGAARLPLAGKRARACERARARGDSRRRLDADGRPPRDARDRLPPVVALALKDEPGLPIPWRDGERQVLPS